MSLRLSLLIALLVVGCGGVSATPSPSPTSMTHQLTVRFDLYDADIGGTTSSCYGIGGYSDFQTGMQVTVKDAAGAIVAFGTLNQSRMQGAGNCALVGQVNGLPEIPIYVIEAGHRGSLNYSLADMKGVDWVVKFTLGNAP